ncbi:hypothetical protein DV737_g5805, partial [Chaetothyriales sp. CBS 132003]
MFNQIETESIQPLTQIPKLDLKDPAFKGFSPTDRNVRYAAWLATICLIIRKGQKWFPDSHNNEYDAVHAQLNAMTFSNTELETVNLASAKQVRRSLDEFMELNANNDNQTEGADIDDAEDPKDAANRFLDELRRLDGKGIERPSLSMAEIKDFLWMAGTQADVQHDAFLAPSPAINAPAYEDPPSYEDHVAAAEAQVFAVDHSTDSDDDNESFWSLHRDIASSSMGIPEWTDACLQLGYTEEQAGQGNEAIRIAKSPFKPEHAQVLAAAWMQRMEASPIGGGILALDAGLGKTLTTLFHIVLQAQRLEAEHATGVAIKALPTLVVCPAIVIPVWHAEIKANFKEFAKDRQLVLEPLTASKTTGVDNYGYDDRVVYMNPMRGRFLRVVCDEGQKVKNIYTKTHLGIWYSFARHYWIVSATPMLNSAVDLLGYLWLFWRSSWDVAHHTDKEVSMSSELYTHRGRSTFRTDYPDYGINFVENSGPCDLDLFVLDPVMFTRLANKGELNSAAGYDALRAILGIVQFKITMATTILVNGKTIRAGSNIVPYKSTVVELRPNPFEARALDNIWQVYFPTLYKRGRDKSKAAETANGALHGLRDVAVHRLLSVSTTDVRFYNIIRRIQALADDCSTWSNEYKDRGATHYFNH